MLAAGPRHRRRLSRILVAGALGSLVSAATALACSRRENGHAAWPMNAVTHIYDGGEPPAHDGHRHRNTLLGFAIHTGGSIFWAACHDALFGRAARRGLPQALGAAATVSASAYVVDYYVVAKRFRPGFEAYLSGGSLLAVYAALAAGFALAGTIRRARAPGLPRGLRAPRARPRSSATHR